MGHIIDVLNGKVKRRGISTAELARRVSMDDELLRRSLSGSRKLTAVEFVNLCHELELDVSDFDTSEDVLPQ